MKTVTYDLVCLDGTYDSQSNAINYARASHAVREG
jgi:hypothetical protein